MPESVTDPYQADVVPEMTAIGWLLAAGAVFLLLPVLPFALVAIVLDWLRGSGDDDGDSEEYHPDDRGTFPGTAA